MKKIIIVMSSFFIIGLVTGCSNEKNGTSATSEVTETTTSNKKQSEYDAAMSKGKEAIVDKDSSKAIGAFQLALEYKKDSKEAKKMIEQVTLYQEAISLKEEKDYSNALKKLSELGMSKEGSTSLKRYGKELTDEINKERAKERATKREASKKEAEKTAETTTQTKETPALTPAPTPTPAATTLWSHQKRLELFSFMQSWGSVMGQTYLEYAPGTEADWYGYSFPSVLSNNNIAVGGSQATLQWSTDGNSRDIYNVVAIYSDIATTDKLKRHLYLFTILNGQPIVLVTMQNQGNNENMIYFDQSQNADLNNGFATIVGNG